MSALSVIIIWCDVTFENGTSYQPMKDECEETTNGTPKKPVDSIDMAIFNVGTEVLRRNNVQLITVRTSDEALRDIGKNKDKKTFVICSGTVGRHLVPKIVREYSHVHDIYIYTHNIALHVDWVDHYRPMAKMFNFHTTLLVRLTRNIAAYLIERGQMYLKVDAPQDAFLCFQHAQSLEVAANVQDKVKGNPITEGPSYPLPDFREHLELLEGNDGLIEKATAAMRAQGYSLESS